MAPTQEMAAVVTQLDSLQSNHTEQNVAKQDTAERIRQVRASLEEQDETLLSSTTIDDNRQVSE